MKINSELPNCMLKNNNTLNEYDFVLFHLYISNEEYKKYYLDQRISNPNRLMILDNSAYEFFVKGEELEFEKYVNVIQELKPDIYILPDVLMNANKTVDGVVTFLDKYSEYITYSKPMAVTQGNTEEEMLGCMDVYKKLGVDHIAIPFHNTFFKVKAVVTDTIVLNRFLKWHNASILTDDIMYAIGRVNFVQHNFDQIRDFKYVHMLGSHDPFEKVFYKDFDSMDTGYPVKCALKGYPLGEEVGKPDIIIDEFLDKELDCDTKDLIVYNVYTFKNLNVPDYYLIK